MLKELNTGKHYQLLIRSTVATDKIQSMLQNLGIAVAPDALPKILFLLAEKYVDDLSFSYWWQTRGSQFTQTAAVKPMKQVFLAILGFWIGVAAWAQDGYRISPGDILRIEVLDFWQSPHSGGRYPSRWRIFAPALGLDLEIVPLLADQELQTSVRYWEGAVAVRGTQREKKIHGHGYVELTGYDSNNRSAE